MREADAEARDAALADALAPINDAKMRAIVSESDYNHPDPTCETCSGTGLESTTSNPQGHWDWYVIGGRWAGGLSEDRNVTPVRELDGFRTYAMITPDGVWHARGRMGWWGMSSGDESIAVWSDRQKEILSRYAGEGEYLAVLCDLHT